MSLPTPYYHDEAAGITIYHGDCREILPHLPKVDLVLTDPPYGETALTWDSRVRNWADLLQMNSGASLWCFGSMRMFMEQRTEFDGWQFAQDIVWEKQNGTGFCSDRFKRVHEYVMQWYRGTWDEVIKFPVKQIRQHDKNKSVRTRSQKTTVHRGKIGDGRYIDDGTRLIRSVIATPNCHSSAEHPTQKPTELIEVFILYSCPIGGVVLDPFAGSGSTLVAAKDLGRKCIGIEIEEKYCEIAVRRLQQEVLPL